MAQPPQTFPLMIGAQYFYRDKEKRVTKTGAIQYHEIIMATSHMSNFDFLREVLERDFPRPEHYQSATVLSCDIISIKVHWSTDSGQGPRLWPAETDITGNNTEAVMEMLKVRPGRDMLVVTFGCDYR